jgi:hypothetical protein
VPLDGVAGLQGGRVARSQGRRVAECQAPGSHGGWGMGWGTWSLEDPFVGQAGDSGLVAWQLGFKLWQKFGTSISPLLQSASRVDSENPVVVNSLINW